MYSDEDGVASKESEAVYWARIRILLYATSVLSWLGFIMAVVSGEYTREELRLDLLCLHKLLWPILSLHSFLLHRNESPVKIYVAGLGGSLLSILTAASRVVVIGPANEKPLFAFSVNSGQFCAAVLLAIIQILFPRRPVVFTTNGEAVDFENSSSAFQRYSMQWCTTVLRLSGKNGQFPVLDHRTRSKTQPLITLSKTSLWDHIIAERYYGFAKQWTLMLVRSIVTFASPYCVMQLLKCLEDNDSHDPTKAAWIWLLGIGISATCDTIIHYHLAWIQWSEMGIPVRAQLIMGIFHKALRSKDSKDPKSSNTKGAASDKPEAVNLISSDTFNLSRFTALNYHMPFMFIKFFLASLFLLKLLGWQSTLVGMMVTVACVPIHTMVIKQERVAQKQLTAERDRKTKAITEVLHALQHIKFYTLEDQWEERIQTFRQEEIKCLRRKFMASNIRSVWKVASPLIVASAAITTYAYMNRSIAPSIILPMVQLLPHLQGALGFVPVVFQDYFGARANSRRIDEFLRRPEQKRILESSLSGTVLFQDASFSWPTNKAEGETDQETDREKPSTSSHSFALRGINLEFPAGELSVIHGKIGCGKSLLLAAILGEVELLSGRIEAPSIADGQPIAFVSQTPWLQNTTIKENILFGSLFDQARYEKVLKACALYPDLEALPKGDETQIGLRGVKLSGGQRVRVSFARALYSSVKTIVLDDIFSALDSHVSKEILNALTSELCKGRTRILATHHVSLCLPKTRYIVHIENNTIAYAGNTDSMTDWVDIDEPEEDVKPNPPMEKSTGKATKNLKTKTLSTHSDAKVYITYFTAAGGLGFTLLYLLGLVTKQLLSALTTWTLGRVNSGRPKTSINPSQEGLPPSTNLDSRLQHYFYMYLLSSLLSVVFEFLFNLHTFSGSLRASTRLFNELISTVLRMPLQWLDNTPVGEMLKRFTVDTRMVDIVLGTMSEVADCFVKTIIIVSIGVYTSKYTGFLTLALLYASIQVGLGYINARKSVRRADSQATADILEYFTSSTTGVSTIRAFGATDRFAGEMHNRVDKLSTAKRHFWIFNRWLGLQMSLISIVFSIGTGVILLSSKSAIVDAALVGFSLTFSMELAGALFNAVNSFGQLESQMDSVGAITSYAELETENQNGNNVPEDWPANGEVQVKSLDVAYSNDLPLVLKDVSFSIGAGQRIGIVGRTGAGKSSLTLALLRLIEPRGGSISIDGIDISTIKLRSLRSKIAFIPQDPILFSGTVRSNLDYFHKVPETKLKEALRRVRLLAEEGDEKSGLFTLDSAISAGGANISHGQRQLLCLTRILIQDPKIVILDEATSAIDNKTDLWIQETIQKEMKNRTLIVVAHRLRTVASFDQLIVFRDGRIAEMGKPADLFKVKGLFYELVQDSTDKESLIQTLLE